MKAAHMKQRLKSSGLGRIKHTPEELSSEFVWKRYIAKEESIR